MNGQLNHLRQVASIFVTAIAVAGCGGGESGSGSVTPKTSVATIAGNTTETVSAIADSETLAGLQNTPNEVRVQAGAPSQEQTVSTDKSTSSSSASDSRVVTVQNLVYPSQLRLWTWASTTPTTNINSNVVLAASAMTYTAWNSPAYRYRVDENNRFLVLATANGDAATKACQDHIEQCRAGTLRILNSFYSRLRDRLATTTCPNGTHGDVFLIGNDNNGRSLLSTSPSAMRVVAYSTAGIMIYTGINWAADLIGPYDPTKLSVGAKQWLIWMTGAFLTAYIGQDLKVFGADGLIVIQNTAVRAFNAAWDGLPAVLTHIAQTCPYTTAFWPQATQTEDLGWDIEMGRLDQL